MTEFSFESELLAAHLVVRCCSRWNRLVVKMSCVSYNTIMRPYKLSPKLKVF